MADSKEPVYGGVRGEGTLVPPDVLVRFPLLLWAGRASGTGRAGMYFLPSTSYECALKSCAFGPVPAAGAVRA